MITEEPGQPRVALPPGGFPQLSGLAEVHVHQHQAHGLGHLWVASASALCGRAGQVAETLAYVKG